MISNKINDKFSAVHLLRDDESASFRHLWSTVFGDSEKVINDFIHAWGDEISIYVISTMSGEVTSSLCQFKLGTLNGKDVLVSYAICTNEGKRNNGLASALTIHAKDVAILQNAVSILSPASPSLVSFYEKLGYKPAFYATKKEWIMPASSNASSDLPQSECKKLTSGEYNTLRENILNNIPHVTLSDNAINYIASYSEFYESKSTGAICCVENNSSSVSELLYKNMKDINNAKPFLLPKTLSEQPTEYLIPTTIDTISDAFVHGMIAGENLANDEILPWLGFAFE